jgi:hypothetical protein
MAMRGKAEPKAAAARILAKVEKASRRDNLVDGDAVSLGRLDRLDAFSEKTVRCAIQSAVSATEQTVAGTIASRGRK